MLHVGLTGGIGAGKSTVARRLERHGAVLIDADVIAREVVEPGTAGFQAVVDEFGPVVVTPEGALDRAAIGDIVFADANRREALNAIVHPLVYQRRQQLFLRAEPDTIVVEDIPLLVENGLGAGFHLVMVVYAPADERVRRLVTDRGMVEDDALSRVRAQAGDDARRAAADVWLENSGALDELLAQVDDVWDGRIVPFEQNVREGTPANSPALSDLVAYDESWPQDAERLGVRVAAALGDSVVRVDHVGGTAVSGLVSRDLIDLLVTVHRGDDGSEMRELLANAGFAAQAGSSRRYASADPGRPSLVHVVEHGSQDWRVGLLLRDWLRANADERATYNQWEQDFAAAGDATPDAYRDAKARWWGPALERAEKWAAQSGWNPPSGKQKS